MTKGVLPVCCQLDDVVDAIPVHFFGGMWGVLATGLLVDPELMATNTDGSKHDAGLFYDGSALLGWQLIGIVAIVAWTASISFIIFGTLDFVGWLRLSEDEEKLGREVYLLMQKRAKMTSPGNSSTDTPFPDSSPIHVPIDTTNTEPMTVIDLKDTGKDTQL